MQYIQIKESIVEQIEQGLLVPGQKLPSERQLAESFSTTRVTLREALSILETNGLIYREDRRGWFIAFPRIRIPMNDIVEIASFVPENRFYANSVLSIQTIMATKEINALMDLPPFSKVHIVQVLHEIDARPVALSRYWMKEALTPKLPQAVEESGCVLNAFQPILALLDKTFSVTVKGLEGDAALKLRATEGTPGLLVKRTFRQDDKVEFVEITSWRHDAIELY
ncbi:GntR family transcriptional regulator [Vibrio viridaestus]|uniref:GntR family transcriptional regulator n=1 Tax=Vibrio viridaestus TaxID=2487322 RepID=A0A3N9TLU1_9VIBR|nr:GntR family transcriptional regulator [Vibrio viridaestus]RQW64595.1 GntR family transcriptional regulator [Vibrio viridaestus]